MMYANFRWLAKWLIFGETLQTPNERLAFYSAIWEYGVYADEPLNLSEKALKYFNEIVRPELDMQHGKQKLLENE